MAFMTVGGLLGTFLFLVKPIDRLLIQIHMIMNATEMGRKYLLLNPLNSPLLAEEKAKINAAIFFSLSALLSGPMLSRIHLSFPLYIQVLGAIPTLAVAVWESRVLLKKKVWFVGAHYYLYRTGKTASAFEIASAIERKDWDKVNAILPHAVRLSSIETRVEIDALEPADDLTRALTTEGFCPSCSYKCLFMTAKFCPRCGKKLMGRCPSCQIDLTRLALEEVPRFCPRCGVDLRTTKSPKEKS